MGIYNSETYLKKICVKEIEPDDLTNWFKETGITLGTIVECLHQSSFFSYDHSTTNQYFVKIDDTYYPISENAWNNKFQPVDEWREKQIDLIIA